MGISSLIMYVLVGIILIISFIKDRQKTKKAIKKRWMAFIKLIPVLVPLFLIVGIVLTFSVVSNITLIIVYLIGSIIVEKLFTKEEMTEIYDRANQY